jgi:transcription elongation factor GreA
MFYIYNIALYKNMNIVPMTVDGALALKNELHQLKSIERPAVINAISEARAQGDLSENAEYDAAKEKQSFIEGRIQEIEAKLSSAKVINPLELEKDGRVVFGVSVVLQDIETETQVKYQIVGEDEANVDFNKISINSPIARALIGKSDGDVVTVRAPKGDIEYEILDVLYI